MGQNHPEHTTNIYIMCVCICGFLLLGRYHQTWPPSSHISPIRAGPFSRSAPVPSAASLPAGPRVVIRMAWPANSQHFSVWYSLPHPLSHHYHHSPHLQQLPALNHAIRRFMLRIAILLFPYPSLQPKKTHPPEDGR